LDSYAGRVHIDWDTDASISPLGQFPFFIYFLKTAGLFDDLVEHCPLHYLSPNAPSKRDLLGAVLLSVLSGHRSYAHISALRCDSFHPSLFGMKRALSEDAFRRSLEKIAAEPRVISL
jgi:hypothetical protein